MSKLNSLEIRGVRSFDPEQDSKISFNKPLTVISGMNGCGKTTVIECLKFVCTGVLPPGSNSGRSFIYDPTLANQPEVKAKITLKFQNRANRFKVVRSMRLTKKKAKMEYRQLEGLLQTRNANGVVSELSGHCAEIDNLCPKALNVNRAILENVLLCHQEDSTWPLQEAAQLKKKFDDIFESTRYSKALEEIKKQRKRLTEVQRTEESTRDILRVHKQRATELRVEEQSVSEKVADLDDQVGEMRDSAETLEQEIAQLEGVLKSVARLRNELQVHEASLESNQSTLIAQERELDEEADYVSAEAKKDMSPSQVQDMADEIKAECGRVRQDLKSKMHEIRTKNDLGEELRRELSKKRQEETKYETQSKFHAKTETSLLDKLRMVCLTEQLQTEAVAIQTVQAILDSGNQQNISAALNQRVQAVEQAIAKVESVKRDKEHALSTLQKAIDVELRAGREAVSKADSNKRVVDAKITSLEKALAENAQSVEAMKTERAELQAQAAQQHEHMTQFARDIQVQEEQVTSLKQRLVDLNVEGKMAALGSELRDVEREKKEVADKISRLESQQEYIVSYRSMVDQIKDAGDTLQKNVNKVLVGIESQHDGQGGDALGLESGVSAAKDLEAVASTPFTSIDGYSQTVNSIQSLVEEVPHALERAMHKQANEENRVDNAIREKDSEKARADALKAQLEASLKSLREEKASLRDIPLPQLAKDRLESGAWNPSEIRDELSKEQNDASRKLEKLHSNSKIANTIIDSAFSSREEGGACCPICLQDVNDETYPASDKTRWSDKMTRAFDPEGKLTCDIDYQHKGTSFSFKKGEKLRGLDFFLAHWALDTQSKGGSHAAKINTVKQKLEQAVANLKLFNESLPKVTRRNNCQQAILEKEEEFAATLKSIDAIQQEIDSLSIEKESAEKRVKVVRELLTRAERLKPSCEQLSGLVTKAEDVLKKLGLVGGMVSGSDAGEGDILEQTRQLQQEIFDKHNELLERREKERSVEAKMHSELQQSQTKLHELRQAKNKLIEGTNRHEELTRQIKELEERMRDGRNSLLHAKQELRKSTGELEDAAQALQQQEAVKQKDVTAKKDAFNKLKNDFTIIQSMLKEFQQNMKTNLSVKLGQVREECDILENKATAADEEKRSLQELKDQLENKLETLGERETQLRFCFKVVSLRAQVSKLQQKVGRIRKDIQGAGAQDADNRLGSLRKKLGKVSQEKARVDGRRAELNAQRRTLVKDLKKPEFLKIDNRYRQSTVKASLTKIAGKDLELYYNALDNGLMQFHKQKIEQVNESIADLWPLMYQGGDIDSIEIRSERATTGRSNYNYRVVMTKGSKAVDMRGRCSAGQKVLASLVIRMALAEAFSVDCGIFTLDEPTTNLDRRNIDGFARALSEVLKRTRGSDTFQLVVITHDADFVESLKNLIEAQDSSAGFYTVQRQINPRTNQFVSSIIKGHSY